MLNKIGNYRSTLYLTSAIALMELAIFLYLASFNFEAANRFIIRPIGSLVIVFGIWVQSKIARYLGAAWLAMPAAVGVWALLASDRVVVSVASALLLIVGALGLVASFILLFSKTFSDEFAHERQGQPRYKTALRRVAFVALIAAIVVATLNDIYNIALRLSS